MPLRPVLIDGLPCSSADSVSVTDDGFLRGDGVFEVVRLYDGRPFALADHLARLASSADALRLSVDIDAVRTDALMLARQAVGHDAVLRLVMTRGGRRVAVLEDVPAFPATVSLARVVHAPDSLIAGLKTLSYAANMLATRIAREHNADEALLVTPDGHVLEGPSFAVFFGFASGAPLVTPPLSEGILDSITRRRLLGLVEVAERPIAVAELDGATEAFAASTLREVSPISRIDGRVLGAVPGPRTAVAAYALRSLIGRELACPTVDYAASGVTPPGRS